MVILYNDFTVEPSSKVKVEEVGVFLTVDPSLFLSNILLTSLNHTLLWASLCPSQHSQKTLSLAIKEMIVCITTRECPPTIVLSFPQRQQCWQLLLCLSTMIETSIINISDVVDKANWKCISFKLQLFNNLLASMGCENSFSILLCL